MASVGHIAVGLAAARIHQSPRQPLAALPTLARAAFWSALALLPDADVIGRSFGIRGTPWGHRGFTHSITFAIVVGGLVGIAGRAGGWPVRRTIVAASLVLLSHPLLDMMTNGGGGCAIFWPFDSTRYFLPWNPIPVSPLGLNYISTRGLVVALAEIVLFFPVWLFALWPPRR